MALRLDTVALLTSSWLNSGIFPDDSSTVSSAVSLLAPSEICNSSYNVASVSAIHCLDVLLSPSLSVTRAVVLLFRRVLMLRLLLTLPSCASAWPIFACLSFLWVFSDEAFDFLAGHFDLLL